LFLTRSQPPTLSPFRYPPLFRSGHTPKSPSTIFDEAFSEQVISRGKIEDGLVLRNFFKRTGQPLNQPWLIAMVGGLIKRFPVFYLMKLGFATVFRPKTKGWNRARDAINEYAEEREAANRKALGLGSKGAK